MFDATFVISSQDKMEAKIKCLLILRQYLVIVASIKVTKTTDF